VIFPLTPAEEAHNDEQIAACALSAGQISEPPVDGSGGRDDAGLSALSSASSNTLSSALSSSSDRRAVQTVARVVRAQANDDEVAVRHHSSCDHDSRGGDRLVPHDVATRAPGLDALSADPSVFAALPPHMQSALYEKVAALEASLRAKILMRPAQIPPRPEEDHLLTPQEAAAMFKVNRRWLLAHADQIPGVRRLSKKTIRFNEQKLRLHLIGRRA
jgi:hypothetical protein